MKKGIVGLAVLTSVLALASCGGSNNTEQVSTGTNNNSTNNNTNNNTNNATQKAVKSIALADGDTTITKGNSLNIGAWNFDITYTDDSTARKDALTAGVTIDTSKLNLNKAGTYDVKVSYLGIDITVPVTVEDTSSENTNPSENPGTGEGQGEATNPSDNPGTGGSEGEATNPSDNPSGGTTPETPVVETKLSLTSGTTSAYINTTFSTQDWVVKLISSDGKQEAVSKFTTTGNVDTSKKGIYPVTITYNNYQTKVYVTVIDNKASEYTACSGIVKDDDVLGITVAEGDLESAYFEMTNEPIKVEYRIKGNSDWIMADKELIRQYSTYYRVDVPGLMAGNYEFRLFKSDTNTTTVELTVQQHDRSGFAWIDGTGSGAYTEEGVLRTNAKVLYITNQNKDTIKTNVVTSSKGATTACTGLLEVLDAYKKNCDKQPLDVRFIGEITDLKDIDGLKQYKGDLCVDSTTMGVTLEGIGNDATINGMGIRLKGVDNVEVRNLGFMNCNSDEGDNIGLQQDNKHVWIHNNDMFYGNAGSDKDQVKGDGALDCKKSTYVTFSYNHFWDNGKCNLLGLSEGTTEGLFITYHHNWYDHSDSRHPRVRYYSAHVYNNYYDGNAKYGVGSTLGSSVFVESNYFRNCNHPVLTSMQGSDIVSNWDTLATDVTNLATFSKEDGGTIKMYGNTIVGGQKVVSYQENQQQFDCYMATTRDEKVPNTVKSIKGGNTYNNFDTDPTKMYTYKADTAEEAKANVTKFAGRVQGGDFKWTFTEADDSLYEVNQPLKDAITAYKGKMVSAKNVQ